MSDGFNDLTRNTGMDLRDNGPRVIVIESNEGVPLAALVETGPRLVYGNMRFREYFPLQQSPEPGDVGRLLDALEMIGGASCADEFGFILDEWGRVRRDAIAQLRALVRTEAETEVLRRSLTLYLATEERAKVRASGRWLRVWDPWAEAVGNLPADELARLEAPK